LLTLILAAWWVLYPVLPHFHMAFAGHKHVFCQHHHRYEDLIPEDGATPSGAIPEFAHGSAETLANAHQYCPVSNLTLHNQAICARQVSVALVALDRDPAPRWPDSLNLPHSILSEAPKHSPPPC